MLQIKKRLKRLGSALGYTVRKVPGLDARAEQKLYAEVYGEDAVVKKAFYNFGAGGFRHPLWTNVDHPSTHYESVQRGSLHVAWDAMSSSPAPIADGTASIVYCSHVVEHLPDEAALHLIREAHRCLKAGGIFRISTIDVDLDYRAFRANDRRYFNWIEMYSRPEAMRRACIKTPLREASIQQIFLFHFASSASELHVDGVENPISDRELDEAFASLDYESALNFCTGRCSVEVQRKYPGNHITWWNGKKLVDALRSAGFDQVYLSGYGQSVSPVLRDTRYFDATRPTTSVFVEAIK